MKLTDFIESLQKLEAKGHGELEVYAVHGASGRVNELSSAFARTADEADEEYGPFDLNGKGYIEIYEGI